MAQLPETAREALKKALSPNSHPEPGQLSAFLEQALLPRQRESLLEHLAACASCRELLYLSLPAAETAPAQSLPQRRPGFAWGRWAPLRWAGVAASAVIVAGAIWIGGVGRTDLFTPVQAPELQANLRPPAATKESPLSEAQPARPVQAKREAQRVPARTLQARASQGASKPGGPSGIAEDSAPRTMSLAAAAVARARVQQQAAAPAPLVAAQGPAPRTFTHPLWTTSMQQPQPHDTTPQPRWRASAQTLQKSNDGGRTWRDISLPAGIEPQAGSAVGNEVWLGVSGGVLFHSSDGGVHWIRLLPSVRGTHLRGDIISIQFSDPQHGTVLTRTGAKWSTADAGATWSIQSASAVGINSKPPEN